RKATKDPAWSLVKASEDLSSPPSSVRGVESFGADRRRRMDPGGERSVDRLRLRARAAPPIGSLEGSLHMRSHSKPRRPSRCDRAGSNPSPVSAGRCAENAAGGAFGYDARPDRGLLTSEID